MTEYRSVTHTINELLARKKIKAVPRKEETPRKELKNVARPDDDRGDDIPTRQGEIQMKVIDEQELGPITPKEAKKPKKLEIQDVGKQPPTKVEINPELDNTPNLFASKEDKGKLVESDKPDEKSRREAEAIAKFAQSFSGKTVGGFKITGKLTDKDIERGARIRARLNKLKETSLWRQERQKKVIDEETLSEDKYSSVAIQYQTKNGIWVTARKVRNDPSDMMLAMKTVQKAYSSNRIRAIGPRGTVLDFWPIDQESLQQNEETQIDELKKETLLSFMNKRDKQPQKDAKEMKKVWQWGVWPAKERVYRDRFWTKTKPDGEGWKEYHPGKKYISICSRHQFPRPDSSCELCRHGRWVNEENIKEAYYDAPYEPARASEEEKEAYRRFMKTPSSAGEEMHKAQRAWRAIAFRRVWKEKHPVKEETINEYGTLGLGAMHRWPPRHTEHGPAHTSRSIPKERQKKTRQANRGFPDIEKTYGAGRRQRERDVKEETSKKELKQAKKRTAEAWWSNKPKSLENFKQVTKALRDKELDEQKKKEDTFTQELGQRGATGTWGTKLDKISTTLKPGAAEVVRSWAKRAGTPEYVGSSLATGVLATATHTSTLPLMLKGSEMKRRKAVGEQTILNTLNKIITEKKDE